MSRDAVTNNYCLTINHFQCQHLFINQYVFCFSSFWLPSIGLGRICINISLALALKAHGRVNYRHIVGGLSSKNFLVWWLFCNANPHCKLFHTPYKAQLMSLRVSKVVPVRQSTVYRNTAKSFVKESQWSTVRTSNVLVKIPVESPRDMTDDAPFWDVPSNDLSFWFTISFIA